ncbi:PREDICTED: uncharacterized protein LOC109342262 [Lupinus angustifolius]|uniref:uncharacterized protein LOC109342262 n=1 Tax=Lupinus angustifolius TaxID=3871 RepID=UPI00092EFB08|nr:PREDICTED: uncharacterized protein LOC109342262 [Lupinus angustifolius]
MENVQYATWAELFKIHARSHMVLHGIILSSTSLAVSDHDTKLWSTLDVVVLQWIYATMSHDLLHTILELDATSMEAWNRLRDIFQDNKNSWAITLEQELSHTNMEDFPNAFAYCQRLKELSDQLKNVGAPISNNCLVPQIVAGLTEAYNGVATLIRQSDPLPQFYPTRSMIMLEEAGLAKKVATSVNAAMMAQNYDSPPHSRSSNPNRHATGGKKGHNHNNNGRNSGGRGGAKNGSGGGHNGGRHDG